jgi:hypothetical protein
MIHDLSTAWRCGRRRTHVGAEELGESHQESIPVHNSFSAQRTDADDRRGGRRSLPRLLHQIGAKG